MSAKKKGVTSTVKFLDYSLAHFRWHENKEKNANTNHACSKTYNKKKPRTQGV